MAYDNGASAKIHQSFFSDRKVPTSKSLVGSSSKKVATAPQKFGEMHAITFAAGEDAYFLLLFAAFVEGANRRGLSVANIRSLRLR